MSQQLEKKFTPKQSLVSAARTASGNGTGVDTLGAEEIVAVLDVGAVSGTTPTLDVKLQESATSGGTYTDIPGATIPQVTNSNHGLTVSYKPNVGGRLRFVRAIATIGGTTPSFTCAVVILVARPLILPAAAGA